MALIRTAAIVLVLTSLAAGPVFSQQSGGNAPRLQKPGLTLQKPGATAQSGEMSDAMVRKVSAALRHVVAIRQTYEQHAKSTNTQQQRNDLNRQAGKEVAKAISDQGLTVQQYQNAIEMARTDPTLRQRLIARPSNQASKSDTADFVSE